MAHVLDIETAPLSGAITNLDERYLPKIDSRLSDPEKIKAAKEELSSKIIKAKSLDPDFGRVVAIGIKDSVKGTRRAWAEEDERAMLTDFFKFEKSENPSYSTITFNGIDFDLPFLFRRGLYQKVAMPFKMTLRRYSFIPHFDTLEALTNWDRTKRKSLEFYVQAFGLTAQKTGDGSEVNGLYLAKDWDGLKTKVLADVDVTYELYNLICDYFPIAGITRIDRG